MTLKDHPLTVPIVDICEPEDNPTSREGNTSATEPSDERLGKEIVARVDAGDKCEDRAIDKFRSAGHMLIQAKQRVSNFSAFLRDHCNNLSRSRADELIKIAEGRIDEVRAKSNARKRRFRLRKAAAAAEAGVRSGTDTDSTGCQLSSAAALVALTNSADLAVRVTAYRGGFGRTDWAAVVGTTASENGLTGGPVGIGGHGSARRNLGFCYRAYILVEI